MNNDLNMNKIDDTISRQAAIKAIGEKPVAWSKGEYEQGLQNQWGYDVSAIKQLPPAQPERIKGHWIKISPANIYECSECGKSVMTNDICAYDFCHGCGAEIEVTT